MITKCPILLLSMAVISATCLATTTSATAPQTVKTAPPAAARSMAAVAPPVTTKNKPMTMGVATVKPASKSGNLK